MKLELTKEFYSLLQKAKLIVPKNTKTLPILEYGKVFSEEGNLWLEVTDLGNCLRLKMGEQEFSGACIPIDQVYQIVKNLGLRQETKRKSLFGQKAFLELSETEIKISQGELKYEFNTLPSGDFPVTQQNSFENKFKISQEDLLTFIKKVIFAVNRDNFQYVTSGVHFLAEQRTLSVVATDGHRLSLTTCPIESAEKISFTLHYPTIHILTKLLNKKEAEIEVSQENNLVKLSEENWSLLTRSFVSSYPEWEFIIPQSSSREICCKTKELKTCLEQIKKLLPKEKFICVEFEVKEDRITIKQKEKSLKQEIKCKLEGEEISFGVNLSYLLDVLNVFDNQEIYLAMTNNISPILICDYKKGWAEKYVIMPLRIANVL